MPKRSSTRKPKEDFSQTAFRLVQALTSEEQEKPQTSISGALDDASLRKAVMREMGRRGGKKGGKARAENLTDRQRAEIASIAAQARWKKSS